MGLRTLESAGDVNHSEHLRRWFRSSPGASIAAIEAQLLGTLMPDLFGYHLVQLGCHAGMSLTETSRISHRVHIELGGDDTTAAGLLCHENALPLAANAIDVVLLPHVLEFVDDPRRVLREVERILIGEGHVVLLGLNPFSAFGAATLVRRWRGHPPWNAHFISRSRAVDWLELLGFDIVKIGNGSFRPLLKSETLNQRLLFLEKLGAFCWPRLGNFFYIVARKRVEGITPLKMSWRQRRSLVATGVAEPTTRNQRTEVNKTYGQ